MNKSNFLLRLMFALCMFVLITSSSFAQSYTWGTSFGNNYSETIKGVTTDAAGNVYVVGHYDSYLTIGATTLGTSSAFSNQEVFIAKFTAAGVLSWVRSVGGATDDYGNDIAVDAAGNVTVVGSFQGTADFNPSATAVANLTSPGAYDSDGFVLRLNTSGNFVWVKALSGLYYDQANSVGLDAAGNVYVGGVFSTTLDANPGAGVNNLTTAGFEDGFLVKLNSTGNYLWSLSQGGAASDYINDISVDGSGNVVASGSVGGGGITQGLVLKADAAGVLQWNKTLQGGTDFYSIEDIAFDPWGNIFIGGSYFDSLDIDLGPGTNYFIQPGTGTSPNMYVIKLDGTGNTLWAKQTYDTYWNGPNSENLASLAVDAAGSVYVVGTAYGNSWGASFNDPNMSYPSSTQLTQSMSASIQTMYVVKYGKDGRYGNSFQWQSFGATTVQNASAINVDASGNIYAAGSFEGSRNINPFGTNVATATGPYNASDVMLVKFAPPCVIVDAGISGVICPTIPGSYASATNRQLGIDDVGGMSYEWSPSNGLNNAYIATPTASPAVPTTYTVTVTNTLTGCTGTDNVFVDVPTNTLPVYQAGIDKTACLGDSIVIGSTIAANFNCSYFALDPNVQVYAPSAGMNTYISNGTAVIYATVAGTYPIYLDYNDMNYGCYAKDTVMVTFLATPVANPGAAVSICAGGSATIGTATSVGTTYNWSPATGLSATNVQMPIASPTSTTIYTLTVSNGTGCVASNTVQVTVNPLPVANAGADKVKCGTTAVQIGGTPTTGANYLWTPATGLTSATIAQPMANPTAATTYILKVTNATTGCIKRDTMIVTIGTLPTVSAGTDKSICKGSPTTIGGTSSVGMIYSWYPNIATTATTSVSPSATTNYYLTVTNPTTGCSKTDDVKVVVKSLPVVNAGPDLTVCSGTGIAIGTNAITGQTYAWSPSTGLSSATTAKPTATRTVTTAPANYMYIVTATKNACTAKDTMILTVNNLPTANAGTDKTVCSGTSTVIGVAATAGNLYEWTPATTLSNAFISNPSATPTANTTYILTVTNATSGCAKKDTTIFTVNAKPVANAGTDKWLTNCNAVTIGAAAVTGVTYAWTPTTGLSNATISNPTASPSGMPANGLRVYTVTASKVYGTMTCTATDAMDFHSPATACAGAPESTGNNGQTAPENNVENILSVEGVNIYPNPFSNELNVVSDAVVSGNYHISIVNALGQVVYDNKFSMNEETLQTRIDMEKYSAGFYFLTLESNTGKITKKLIKE